MLSLGPNWKTGDLSDAPRHLGETVSLSSTPRTHSAIPAGVTTTTMAITALHSHALSFIPRACDRRIEGSGASEKDFCKEAWITNILYISNLYPGSPTTSLPPLPPPPGSVPHPPSLEGGREGGREGGPLLSLLRGRALRTPPSSVLSLPLSQLRTGQLTEIGHMSAPNGEGELGCYIQTWFDHSLSLSLSLSLRTLFDHSLSLSPHSLRSLSLRTLSALSSITLSLSPHSLRSLSLFSLSGNIPPSLSARLVNMLRRERCPKPCVLIGLDTVRVQVFIK